MSIEGMARDYALKLIELGYDESEAASEASNLFKIHMDRMNELLANHTEEQV